MNRNQSHERRVVHGEVLVGGKRGLRKYEGYRYLSSIKVEESTHKALNEHIINLHSEYIAARITARVETGYNLRLPDSSQMCQSASNSRPLRA